MRCLCLADRLVARGHEALFLTRPAEGDLIAEIEARGFSAIRLPGAASEVEDADRCLALTAGGRVDWVVVDHYDLGAAWEARMRTGARALLAIDDLGRAHATDLILDQNLANPLHEGYRGFAGRALLGPGYALIRPGFGTLRAASLGRRTGRIGRILVSMGGTDPVDYTPTALRGLQALDRSDLMVDVVIGRNTRNRETVEALCRTLPGATLHVQRADMETLIAAADLAIGAGGTSVWERCVLGCPALIVSLAPNQVALAQGVADAGAALDLGWHAEAGGDRIAETLRRLSPDTVMRMSDRAADICNGSGADHVTDAMGWS
ncbi:UDP-2,4-diacetamido-2,4,6-trideoxy-beta-L-altropyranose hydrolase [Methylobacterium sp. J-026]|nr:UDP-2,4-diacetamido-2,4,6-trideoxy-beta-L-altropyranose hydrolase [Methylobacterium sp. J-026]